MLQSMKRQGSVKRCSTKTQRRAGKSPSQVDALPARLEDGAAWCVGGRNRPLTPLALGESTYARLQAVYRFGEYEFEISVADARDQVHDGVTRFMCRQ